MPPIVIGGVISWTAVAINVAIAIGASLGMMLITSLMRPKAPTFASESQARTFMVKQALQPWRVGYGRDMVSGTLAYIDNPGDKKYLYMVLVTHGHEITAYDETWIEDTKVNVDPATGLVVSVGKYYGKARFEYKLGAPGEPAFPLLVAESAGNWTAAHRWDGRASVAMRFEISDQAVFPNGMPNVKFVCRQKPVYDLRTGTYGYSENAALCVADYHQSKAFGLGCRGGEATRIQSAGGASTIKYLRDCVTPSVNGQPYDTRVLLQNRGAGAVKVSDNLGASQVVAAGATAEVRLSSVGTGVAFYQFRFETAAAGDSMDIYVSDPVARRQGVDTENFVPKVARKFEGWSAFSGAAITIAQNRSIYREIDEADLIAAANVCDELVALKAGGTEKRYTCNGSFLTSQDVKTTIADLLSAMAGEVSYFGGAHHFYAGAWRSPVMTLTDDDLRGPVRVAPLVSLREMCNTVKAEAMFPANKWQPGDVPAVRNDAYVVQDGEEIVRQITLPYTKSSATAQRIMKIQLEDSRRQESVQYPAKVRAFEMSAPDIFAITRPRYGWTAKTFKIKRAEFVQEKGGDDSAQLPGVNLAGRAIDAGVYAWDPNEEQPLTALPAFVAPDPSAVAPVTGLTADSGLTAALIRSDGVVISRVHVAWTAPFDAAVLQSGSIVIEYKKHADSDWLSAGSVGGSAVETWISDVVDGVSYDFRVTAKNAAGGMSAPATVLGHVVVGVGYGAASYRPTSNPLTASDAGGFPRVTIAAFTMRIAGKGDVAIAGGSVDASSADFGKTAYVFYDDLAFAGGSVVYQMTFTRETALGTTGGRFFVGSISLPIPGGGATVGNNDGGTGAQYARTFTLWPTLQVDGGAWNNLDYAVDPNSSSFADSTATSANSVLRAINFPAYSQLFSQITLKVKHRLAAITGATAQLLIELSKDGGLSWAPLRTVTVADAVPWADPINLPVTQKTEKVQIKITSPGGTGLTPTAKTPGSRVDDASVGTLPWSIGTNAVASRATNGSGFTHYLKATNFGFAIPSSATIVGIQATINVDGSYEEDPTDSSFIWKSVSDQYIYIVKGGVIQTAQNKSSGSIWPSSAADRTYGGSGDLWGQSWAYTDINAAGFGIAISPLLMRTIDASGLTQARVLSITLTVYTTSGSSTSAVEVYEIKMEVTI